MTKYILFIEWNPNAYTAINPNSPISKEEQETPYFEIEACTLKEAKAEAEDLILKNKKYIYCMIIFERTETPTHTGIFGTDKEYKAVTMTKKRCWYHPSNEPELEGLYLIRRNRCLRPTIYFIDPLK